MIVRELGISGLEIEGSFMMRPKEFVDGRGTFRKLFTREALESMGVEPLFAEEYLSTSGKGVLRGLHYQIAPFAQAKLVACLRGRVFDVMLDMRRKSGTYGRWFSAVLSGKDAACIYVPRGVAHGFLSLTKDSLVLYKADNGYSPAHERGVAWDDAQLGIRWPKMDFVVSEKDRAWPSFTAAEKFE